MRTHKGLREGRKTPVRLKDVAAEAGTSVAAVSMVLNQPSNADQIGTACSQRIRTAAERLGYVPNYHAQIMRGRRTGVIGIAMEFRPGFENHLAISYFGTLVGAVDESLRQAGRSLMIVNGMEGRTAAGQGVLALRRKQIDGLIVVGATSRMHQDPVLLDPPSGLPIVVLEYNGATSLPVIRFDVRDGVCQVVEHLAALGHRDLLWVATVPAGLPGGTMVSREQLFMDCVSKSGLRAEVCWNSGQQPEADGTPTPTERTADAVRAALRDRLSGLRFPPPFTAVACFNDVAAMGAYAVFAERGLRIPADLSVTGFDDIQSRLLSPKLTSVSHMLDEMGARAVELLLKMVDNPAHCSELTGYREDFAARLVVRNSTAPFAVG